MEVIWLSYTHFVYFEYFTFSNHEPKSNCGCRLIKWPPNKLMRTVNVCVNILTKILFGCQMINLYNSAIWSPKKNVNHNIFQTFKIIWIKWHQYLILRSFIWLTYSIIVIWNHGAKGEYFKFDNMTINSETWVILDLLMKRNYSHLSKGMSD